MTQQHKYRLLEQAEPGELARLQEQVRNCNWRQVFHIQPSTGLLNDPNGLSYFNDEYHVFYQWYPLGTEHGMKYWYHLKSKDGVNWEDIGIGIKPGDPYDSHGAYSGSAIEHEGKLHLMYTGNTRDAGWIRHPYQCMAVMETDGHITKWEQPVIPVVPEGYTDHFRDPKLWKQGDYFYCVIGAQRANLTGSAVLYRSTDLQEWEFLGEIKTDLNDFGYMWECPDYFQLDGTGVLLFCPQGISHQGDHYHNIYQSGYIMGKPLDVDTLQLTHNQFQELDRGFDFYAPQTLLDGQGRRILIGWMGLPDISYPTDTHGWAHCLTLPRVLSVRDDKLIQQPLPELASLRQGEGQQVNDTLTSHTRSYDYFVGTTYELKCKFEVLDAEQVGIIFRAKDNEYTVIRYDVEHHKLVLDRSSSGVPLATEYEETRQCDMTGKQITLHLFVDVSSVEIFVNEGEEVFTSRIFPTSQSEGIQFFAQEGSARLEATIWQLHQQDNTAK